ncbi:MAG: hypothetical protein ACO3JL_07305 [Myxococcota bacterium]
MLARYFAPLLVAIFLAESAVAAGSVCAPFDVLAGEKATEVEVTEELILPCAAIEGDLLGQFCVEASFYLLTDRGTALCQVTLPALYVALEAVDEWRDGASPRGATVPSSVGPVAALPDRWRPPRGPLVLTRSVLLPCYSGRACQQPLDPPEVPG